MPGFFEGAAGGLLGGIASAWGQKDANKRNEREAQRNRDFQRDMSNTAVSRRMADMRNAGLNPILAGKYDASTPAGAMMTHGNVGGAGVEGAAKGANTALAVQNLKNLEATRLNVMAQTAGLQAQLPRKAIIGDTITSARQQWSRFKTSIKHGLNQTGNIYGPFKQKKTDAPVTIDVWGKRKKR